VIAFALRNWRWIAIAVIFLFMIGGILAYGHRQYERGVADAQEDARVALEKDRELRRQADWKVRQDYETRIADLNAAVARERRGRSIRCVLGDSNEVRAGRDTGGSAEGSTGQPAVQPSGDIRGPLVQFGGQCEALRQQLIAIKARQDALREANP
jgi:hypothetical protein